MQLENVLSDAIRKRHIRYTAPVANYHDLRTYLIHDLTKTITFVVVSLTGKYKVSHMSSGTFSMHV